MLFRIDVVLWFGTCHPGSDCWWSIWPSIAVAAAGALITKPSRIFLVVAISGLSDAVWRQVIADGYAWPQPGMFSEREFWEKSTIFLLLTVIIHSIKGALNWIVRWRNAGPAPEEVVASDEEAAQDEDIAAWRWFQGRSGEQFYILMEILLVALALATAVSVAVGVRYGVIYGVIVLVVLVYFGHRMASTIGQRLVIYDGTEDFRAQYRQRKKKTRT